MTETRTYDVPDISCDHCKSAIEQALRDLPDVTRVEADVATKVVSVDGSATDEAIRSAIERAGYVAT